MVIPYEDKSDEQVLFSREPQVPPQEPTIKFLIEESGNSWTVSAHRHKLIETSPALAVFIASHRDQTTFKITNTDRKAFENFIRHLEGSEIPLTSTKTARNTLDVACQFNCLSLVEVCVKYLESAVNTVNVLSIYRNLHVHCNNIHSFEPSAPSLDATSLDGDNLRIQNLCADLRLACLTTIDAHAEALFGRREFECLDYKDMATVIHRNLHKVNNDLMHDAVISWYKTECKRRRCVESKFSKRGPVADLLAKIRDEYEHDTRVRDVTDADLLAASPTAAPADGHAGKKPRKKPLDEDAGPSNALLNCLLVWTFFFD